MSARVLIVDDVPANVRLLQARLEAEYFEVFTAFDGAEALEMVQRVQPDIVLLDVMMPEVDGIEVCTRIKSNPLTRFLPVIMITALDQPEDRIRGLQAGADDFLVKPVDELTLITRVRSLLRFKFLLDELESSVGQELLLDTRLRADEEQPARVCCMLRDAPDCQELFDTLGKWRQGEMMQDPRQLLERVRAGECDAVVLDLDMRQPDALRVASQIRSLESGRQIPIMLITDGKERERLVRALEVGASDYLQRPVSKEEFGARLEIQLKRWRYIQHLRRRVRQSVAYAMTDPLTGLYNRRYLSIQGRALVEEAVSRGRQLSLLVMDLDFFKRVNDTFGHDVGDEVLREVARRLKGQVRKMDMVCRIGGEEFVVLLPGAGPETAARIGERLRKIIAEKPFNIRPADGGDVITFNMTVSAGLASTCDDDETLEALLKRADAALYKAKNSGRDQVVLAGCAAER